MKGRLFIYYVSVENMTKKMAKQYTKKCGKNFQKVVGKKDRVLIVPNRTGNDWVQVLA